MSTTSSFPHKYQVELALDGALTAAPRAPIAGGSPPQFGGVDTDWSPEHLLLGAAALCLLTTFKALARRQGLEVAGYSCHAEGTLDKTREGLVFTSMALSVEVIVAPGDEARVQQVLLRAKNACIVANSLRCPVELSSLVRADENHQLPVSA